MHQNANLKFRLNKAKKVEQTHYEKPSNFELHKITFVFLRINAKPRIYS